MVFSLKINGFNIRIKHNKLNSLLKPRGIFPNGVEINIDNIWYRVHTEFKYENNDTFLVFYSPYLVENDIVTHYLFEGEYLRCKLNKFKYLLIKMLKYETSFQKELYKLCVWGYNNSNKLKLFSISLILSILYFYINKLTDNNLLTYIGNSNFLQSIFMFITLSGFLSIFFPMTFVRSISETDVKRIIRDVEEQKKRDDDIENSSSF